MEFFEYLSIPQIIIQLARNGLSSGNGGISLGELYILMAVAAGCFVVCRVFGGLALFSMGQRAGVKYSWLGFVPFASTYYTGRLAGEAPFFGRKIKRAGLYAMLAEIVYAALEILYLITSVVLANPAYYETAITGGSSKLQFIDGNVPANLSWMVNASTWFSTLGMVANLVAILFFCVLYNAIFRKYSPREAYALTVFSVLLPVRAFLLFAVRNRTPVDYEEYMQQRIETVMRESGIPMETLTGRQEEDPFSDFATPRFEPSPFEEFADAPKAPEPEREEPAEPEIAEPASGEQLRAEPKEEDKTEQSETSSDHEEEDN